jgi:hypothetical protein
LGAKRTPGSAKKNGVNATGEKETPKRISSVLRISDLDNSLMSTPSDAGSHTQQFPMIGYGGGGGGGGGRRDVMTPSVDGNMSNISAMPSLWGDEDDDDDMTDLVTLDGEGPMDDEVNDSFKFQSYLLGFVLSRTRIAVLC